MNAGFLEIINHGQEEKIRLLQNKVDLYSANLEQYKQKSYNETQVRVDFVNFFFQLLGWDVLNENGLPQHLREVTHEAIANNPDYHWMPYMMNLVSIFALNLNNIVLTKFWNISVRHWSYIRILLKRKF